MASEVTSLTSDGSMASEVTWLNFEQSCSRGMACTCGIEDCLIDFQEEQGIGDFGGCLTEIRLLSEVTSLTSKQSSDMGMTCHLVDLQLKHSIVGKPPR